MSSSVILYSNNNTDTQKVLSITLPDIDIDNFNKIPLFCRGLAFSEDNRYLYVLGVIKNTTTSNININTSAYMNYDSYLIIYDIDTTEVVNSTDKSNITTNKKNTSVVNSNNDTEVINLIKAMMISVNDRLDQMENIMSKHDNQLSLISHTLEIINNKLSKS